MKHKIRMLSTQMGVHDGELHPVPFVEGQEYEIGDDLFSAFINCGAVELVLDEKPQEKKSEGDAPSNKMRRNAPENKSKQPQ
jgi:hypothetical protein